MLVIADDDADMRSLVRATLAADFPDVIELASGRDLFWHLLRTSIASVRAPARPMLVVADVRMPGYTGLEVIDAWQNPERDVPFVVITSFPDEGVRARVAELGATLVTKPFTRAALRDGVRDARRRARKEP
jgi:DNA-binding response OmpR family regulator